MSGLFLIFSVAITIADAFPFKSFKTGCQQSSTDIFFLMDSSGSIETKNFAEQLNFIADVVHNLDMKKDGIHVGLASFSDSFYLNIDLTDDKNAFLSSMSGVFPLSGGTRIGRALSNLQAEGFDSPLARKLSTQVVIIITDGESVDNPFPIAEELKSRGVKIFAIQAKNENNNSELRLIASKPSYRFLFNLDARNVGNALAKTISNIGCKAPEIRENCQRMQQMDFRFLVDLAGFGRLKSNRIMEFTFQSINQLVKKHLNSFFGIHFSPSPNQGVVKIPSMENITAIMHRFDHLQFPGPQGIISSFLQHPKQFNLLAHRKRMVVVFVDESSEPLDELKSAVRRFRSKDRYAAIFIVAIGTTVRTDRAKEIASDRSLFLHIRDINEIEKSYYDFIDILCNPQDYDQSIMFDNIQ